MAIPTPFNLRLFLASLALVICCLTPTIHTKDLMHHRLRHDGDLLQRQHTTDSATTRSRFSNASASYKDFDASVVASSASWTGAKISTSAHNLEHSTKQDQQEQHLQYQQMLSSSSASYQQPQQHYHQNTNQFHHQSRHQENHAAPAFTTTRRKTKSGLLIESNIELDSDHDADESPALAAYTEMDLLQTSSTSSSSPKHERKRNRQNHHSHHQQQSQHQRKRNGRNGGGGASGGAGSGVGFNNGQRQKSQRNGKFPFKDINNFIIWGSMIS